MIIPNVHTAIGNLMRVQPKDTFLDANKDNKKNNLESDYNSIY